MIISVISTTIDGFCNHMDVIADDLHHEFNNQLMAKADTLLLGRKTFELFEDFWPKAVNDSSLPAHMRETAQILTDIRKIVVSSTLFLSNWPNTIFIKDLHVETIRQLKEQSEKGLIVLGSPSVISQLSAAKLIDEYYFLVQPILAGKGYRLFESYPLENNQSLTLLDHHVLTSGVNILHYQKIQ